ncbi:MAG: carbohydrate ABC transporter permease, partial [[Clostridium] leptum]
LWPLLVIQTPPKQTLPLIISGMNAAYYIDYGPIMVAILIATLPLIVIFLTLQEQFVSGIVGASK